MQDTTCTYTQDAGLPGWNGSPSEIILPPPQL